MKLQVRFSIHIIEVYKNTYLLNTKRTRLHVNKYCLRGKTTQNVIQTKKRR